LKYLFLSHKKFHLYWHICFILLGFYGTCLFGLNLLLNIEWVNVKSISIPNETVFIAKHGHSRSPSKLIFVHNNTLYKAHCIGDKETDNSSLTCSDLLDNDRKIIGNNVRYINIVDKYSLLEKNGSQYSFFAHQQSEGIIDIGTFQYNQKSEVYSQTPRDMDIFLFKDRVSVYIYRIFFLIPFIYFIKGLMGFFYYDKLFYERLKIKSR
ncbi:hypothetical protein, partial [Conchiformibius steedae]|uniref:hypothetical protein n=1 Tax=Conchiformibius steedae TaxID=153493 RepID=UPI0026EB86E7